MKTQYEINGLRKMTEEDIYNEGCIPNTGVNFFIGIPFKADTVDGLVKQIGDFLGIPDKDLKNSFELNACDEDGRIDLQMMEDNIGIYASKSDLDAWKTRNKKLWAGYYTAYVEKVTREVSKL